MDAKELLKENSTITSMTIGGITGAATAILFEKATRRKRQPRMSGLPMKLDHGGVPAQEPRESQEVGQPQTMLANHDDTLNRGRR